MPEPLELGIITDEISPNLAEALEQGVAWGVHRFELRGGSQGRFPFFSQEEIGLVEAALRRGDRITAVSPGILKGPVADEARLRHELDAVLPRAIEGAIRFSAPMLIVFGFEHYDGEPDSDRVRVLRAFEKVAEQAAAANLTVAVENEPHHWVDRPTETVALLQELDHPALRLNWDPANLHWSGKVPTYEDFQILQPYIVNLHVKDYAPDDAEVRWRPAGQGATPWPEILPWIAEETDLAHVTLKTHRPPLIANTERGLKHVRGLLETLPLRTP